MPDVVSLKDGTRIEVDASTAGLVSADSGSIESSLQSIGPLLQRVCHSVVDAWDEVSDKVLITETSIELGIGIEAGGDWFIAKAKTNANIKLKVKIARK